MHERERSQPRTAATGPPAARNRGRARRPGDVTALLPQLLTTGNLAAGFYAISLTTQGQTDRAALAILFAGIFDFFDGRVARRVGATSRFGVEYDSIADTVSFGVAPAILAYRVGELHQLGWSGWVFAFAFLACAALRLARFNVSSGRYEGFFQGLPSPAAAGMVLSSVWFGDLVRAAGVPFSLPPLAVGLGVTGLGLLMVSAIPYRSAKAARIGPSNRNRVLAVMAFVAILIKPGLTLFAMAGAYVLSGPIEMGIRWRRGTSLTEVAALDDGDEDDRSAGGEA